MKTHRATARLFALGIVLIPLHDGTGWRTFRYPNLAETAARFDGAGVHLEVRSSSSPLVYRLSAPALVTRVTAAGRATGLPRLPADRKEGDDDADDFVLRLGLLVEGDDGPGWLERVFAPRWLKDLIDEAPGMRFERVHLLSLAQQLAPGFRRKHPKSKYVDEEVVGRMSAPGEFRFDHALEKPLPVFGVWLHADGDETKSSFDVTLTSLTLGTEDAPDRAVQSKGDGKR